MQQNTIFAAIAVSALCLFGLSNAQVRYQGACPSDVKVMPDFSVEKYLGTWYEYAKYPVYFEADGKCVIAKYTLKEDGDVAVSNSMINEETNKPEDIVGYAKLVSNAKLMVTFPVSPAYNASSNYWVLDSDYENYSVVYSCETGSDGSHYTIVWILTRAQQPSLEVISKSAAILQSNNISLQPMVITDQYNCKTAKASDANTK